MPTKPTFETISKRIAQGIALHLCIAESTVKPDATLEELGADSLDRLELQMAIEDEFAIEVPDEDMEKLTTVGSMVEYVALRTAGVA